MAGDPNARRDKALEALARELAETNKHLKCIADNTRPVGVRVDPPIPPDPFKPTDPEVGVHPYLRRSVPGDSSADTIPEPS